MPTSSIIGASSVAGLAISLAMKDTLQNVFGGTFLAILRPFAEGEEIYILPSGQFRGSADPNVANYKVQNVGWYYTTLIPKDTMPVTVPNGYFIGANVINVTRAVARVIYFDVRLLFSDRDKIPAIRDEVTAFLTNDPRVNSTDFPVRVNLTAVKEDHLVMSVEHHVYKKPLTEHLAMKQDLMMDVHGHNRVEHERQGVSDGDHADAPYGWVPLRRGRRQAAGGGAVRSRRRVPGAAVRVLARRRRREIDDG